MRYSSFLMIVGMLGFVSCKKEGCRDETANNYSSEANVGNSSSCTYEAENWAGKFLMKGRRIPYQTTDTIHYTYELTVTYLSMNRVELSNFGGWNTKMIAELYDRNTQIQLKPEKTDSLVTTSGTYYDQNSFRITYTKGVQPDKYIELATRQ